MIKFYEQEEIEIGSQINENIKLLIGERERGEKREKKERLQILQAIAE